MLRKEVLSPTIWIRSLELSKRKMDRASSLLNEGYHEESLIQSYTSMFHAARAMLFHDNVVEKSHLCVISYLEEHHSESIGLDLIVWLDIHRVERHEMIYGLDQVFNVEDEARLAYQRCAIFHQRICTILKSSDQSGQSK
ncbi:MAG: HEPN domain-containing protein [Candidatus Thermoplasmatota archaeon]|nr:HEPN domain-containing protein [Candidatus Thermoplasmatota archaeon]